MKILFVTNIPSPYRINFFNHLGLRCNLDVLYEAKYQEGIKYDFEKTKPLHFTHFFVSRKKLKPKKISFSLVRYLKKNSNQYDKIILSNYSNISVILAINYMIIKKIDYYLEVDGGIIKKDFWLKRKLKTHLISNAKAIFSPSNYTDQYLKAYGFKRSIFRYPFSSITQNDILSFNELEKNKILARKTLKIKYKKVVITVAQLIHRKGIDVLLKSAKIISSEIDHVGFYVIGDDYTNPYLELKDELDLSNVHFEGFKNKDQLRDYYLAADIFVLPTREDIWGLVINEAMAYGIPVITTKNCVAGIELIKQGYNGFLVDVEDYNGIAKAVIDMLSDNEMLQNFSINALGLIRNYTIEKMAMTHFESLHGETFKG